MVWAQQTSLTQRFLLKCLYQAREVDVIYLCVRSIVLPLSVTLIFDFRTVPSVCEIFIVFYFISNQLLFLPFSRALAINMRSIKHIMHYDRILQLQSNLFMRSPLLSSHMWLKVTHSLSRDRKYHINWTCFKRSPI
jgi:hypothetical protein